MKACYSVFLSIYNIIIHVEFTYIKLWMEYGMWAMLRADCTASRGPGHMT